MFDDEPDESDRDESPAAPEPEEPQGAPAEDQPAGGDEGADEQSAGGDRADEQPVAEEQPAAERAEPRREGTRDDSSDEPEAIPGAHLEPDLVLEEPAAPEAGYDDAAEGAEADPAPEDGETDGEAAAPAPVTTFLELAADARYSATGKRKSAVARVILKPGSGEYTVNGRPLAEFFPRPTLQRTARGPLETVGQTERMDVVAKIHGGGVSAQAGALRHGIARALVEADPNLRGELKRRGFLTRDPRVKERKKAGLKKARKRPQFSKR